MRESADSRVLLHYIYDPLCGWCYGAEPLVRAAEGVAELELRLHAGGLWPEPTRLPEETRRYIQQADARIARMSGQPFGEAYLSGLLLDPTLVLESRPPIAAILAAASIDAGQALPILRAIQHAHYESGRHVVEHEVLCEIAASIGLERAAFERALDAAEVDAHIAATRERMQRVGSRGFPTFVLEAAGAWQPVPHHQFASNTGAFVQWLENAVRGRTSATA